MRMILSGLSVSLVYYSPLFTHGHFYSRYRSDFKATPTFITNPICFTFDISFKERKALGIITQY